MSRRHADNWSPGHYLVDPYTWLWSPDHGHGHEWPTATPFVQCQSALPFWYTAISKFDHEIHGQGHVCGQRSRSRLTFKIQRSRLWSRSNPMVTFEAWSSIDMFAFRFVAIRPFWLRYSKFYIWPYKFKVKVMAKVKSDDHICALEFNRYVCFSFRGNRAIFGWDIANSIFDLEKSRSRSWSRSNPMVTFEHYSSIDMFAFRFVAIGPFLAEI